MSFQGLVESEGFKEFLKFIWAQKIIFLEVMGLGFCGIHFGNPDNRHDFNLGVYVLIFM